MLLWPIGSASAAAISVPCGAGNLGNPALVVGAVNTANAQAGADTIELADGCYYEFVAIGDTWFGTNALPAIGSTITIQGHGATLARKADVNTPAFRLFFVGADPASPATNGYTSPGPGDLTLIDLTVQGGLVSGGSGVSGGGGGAGIGGAIFNMGRLELERTLVYASTATGGAGGYTTGGSGGGGGMVGTGGNYYGGAGGHSPPGSAAGGAGASGAAGGGGGFRDSEAGGDATTGVGGRGGGPTTGTGGSAHAPAQTGGGAAGGDGSGGGGALYPGLSGSNTYGAGGAFGVGGLDSSGGGVGGGGAPSANGNAESGGGGFGGGGGGSNGAFVGDGGFGGGGGASWTYGFVTGGLGGFGAASGRSSSTPQAGSGGGGSGMGGAIFNLQGSVELTSSTLVSNSALGGRTYGTVPGAESHGYGGALFNLNGSVTSESSTFSANDAQNGASTPAADAGSALYSIGYDAATARHATLTLRRTVVSGSPAVPLVVSDAPGQVKPGTANLSSSVVDASDHDLVRTTEARAGGTITGSPIAGDPKLTALGLYRGGLTPAMMPRIGSPVRDAGGTGCPAGDQLGQPRPADFACDIGAVEARTPDNDELANARTLVGSDITFNGDNVAATFQTGEPNPPGSVADSSVWYQWTAASSGETTISVCATNLATVAIGIYTGTAYDNLVAVPRTTGTLCRIGDLFFNAVGGTTYRISVDGAGSQGFFKLRLQGPGGAGDVLAPTATIDSGPTAPTKQARPEFTFHASETSTFRCSIDQGTPAFGTCSQAFTAPLLSDGSWTFRVFATDEAGNAGAPVTRSFTVDSTGPTVALNSGPSGFTNVASPQFAFSSAAGDLAGFECALDSPSFSSCSSPKSYGTLDHGSQHTFRVRALDQLGNVGPEVTRTFTVDTMPPVVTIDSGPTGTVAQTAASFTFSSASGDVARFVCALDDAAPAQCTTPTQYTGVAEGAHVFHVRAVDQAGNTGAEATRMWTVDTQGPVVVITGPDGLTNQPAPSFAFSSSAGDVASFQCALDDAPLAACTSPRHLDAVADGAHTFHVRAVDSLGNIGPTENRSFTVDASPPDTVIDSSGTATEPQFIFHATEAGVTFRCAIDEAAFAACSGPGSTHRATGLGVGAHKFSVFSIDAAGNSDPTPATATFTVTAATVVPPPVIGGIPLPVGETILVKKPKATVKTRAKQVRITFTFRSPTAGATFTCKLDKAKAKPCKSPARYRVKPGRHTFVVTAIGPGGPDKTPARFRFRVKRTR